MLVPTNINLEDLEIFKIEDTSDESDNGFGVLYWGMGFIGRKLVFVDQNEVYIDTQIKEIDHVGNIYYLRDQENDQNYIINKDTKEILEFSLSRDAETWFEMFTKIAA